MCPLEIFFDEQITALARFEETEIERELCTRTCRFELVEQFLVINRL